ncbi:MAG: ImuA family protein [Planctomycetota bacterium]
MTAAARLETIQVLRRQIAAGLSVESRREIVPTGLSELDSILPGNGLPTASIIEWLGSRSGLFAGSIALSAVRSLLCHRPGCLAVIDERHEFHVAAAISQGIPLSRILLVQPNLAPSPGVRRQTADNSRESSLSHEALWALEQAARCPGVNVVFCWMDRCSNAIMRRLQLAVEHSGVTLVMIRPSRVQNQPSFADLRLLVTLDSPSVVTSSDGREPVRSANPSSGITRRYAIRLLRSRHELRHDRTAGLSQHEGRFRIRNGRS